MNRRHFFAVIGAGAIAGKATRASAKSFESMLDAIPVLDAHAMSTLYRGYRFMCSVDGVDVADRCFFADEILGIVECYQKNAKQEFVLDVETNKPKTEQFTGRVSVLPYCPVACGASLCKLGEPKRVWDWRRSNLHISNAAYRVPR